jgi:hypothetical protein
MIERLETANAIQHPLHSPDIPVVLGIGQQSVMSVDEWSANGFGKVPAG